VPAGFTLLSVIAYCLTDASGKILPFTQYDRTFVYDAPVVIESGVTFPGSFASGSVSAAVPAAAKRVRGLMGVTGTSSGGGVHFIAGDANGFDAQMAMLSSGSTATTLGFNAGFAFDIAMLTAQTIYRMVTSGGLSGSGRTVVTGFTF
jgi:hypothetical protein